MIEDLTAFYNLSRLRLDIFYCSILCKFRVQIPASVTHSYCLAAGCRVLFFAGFAHELNHFCHILLLFKCCLN